MTEVTVKNNRVKSRLYRVRRDLAAWEAIRGIWQGKRIADPVAWQRKIRKEWERKLA